MNANYVVQGHNMTVVEADGHYVEPFVVQNLFIYSGETYSVIVKADQDPTKIIGLHQILLVDQRQKLLLV